MDQDAPARPATILLKLREAERERPGGCSLARLRKLCDCRMSELMRDLTVLAGGGWVAFDHDAEGISGIRLSATGRLLCGTLAADRR